MAKKKNGHDEMGVFSMREVSPDKTEMPVDGYHCELQMCKQWCLTVAQLGEHFAEEVVLDNF